MGLGFFGGMRSTFAASCLLASFIGLSVGVGSAAAADCPANPGALGTSRTIAVDPSEHPRLGSFQYRESLPLNDHEVVITFDDGPLPPYSSRILDILASECVKATFFMVGRMARSYPQLVKRAYSEGHTLANHSQNHPFTFHKMTVEQASREIEDGLTSIRTALGDPNGVSDFFRIPGLLRQEAVEDYLISRGYMAWSVDFMADDWTRISADEVVRRALNRLEARGKGILLLHDIKPATALALPTLLHELKARGFKVVHVVQANAEHPKTATLPEQWRVVRTARPGIWPHVEVSLAMPEPVLEAPSVNNFGIVDFGASGRAAPGPRGDKLRADGRDIPLPPISLSPHSLRLVGVYPAQTMPAPDASYFRYSQVWKQRTRAARKAGHKKDATSTATPGPAPSGPAPKHTTGSVSRSTNGPRPPRPIGHQIQLPKQPTAELPQRIGLR
jgi:peptidoglycan/xylan/chitin deacetylase (PgdA/CDA1 family)